MLEARRAALSRSRFSATTISPTALRLPWRRRRFGFGGGLQAGEFWPKVRPHRLANSLRRAALRLGLGGWLRVGGDAGLPGHRASLLRHAVKRKLGQGRPRIGLDPRSSGLHEDRYHSPGGGADQAICQPVQHDAEEEANHRAGG